MKSDRFRDKLFLFYQHFNRSVAVGLLPVFFFRMQSKKKKPPSQKKEPGAKHRVFFLVLFFGHFGAKRRVLFFSSFFGHKLQLKDFFGKIGREAADFAARGCFLCSFLWEIPARSAGGFFLCFGKSLKRSFNF